MNVQNQISVLKVFQNEEKMSYQLSEDPATRNATNDTERSWKQILF